MKWSVAALLVLGIIAAFCAAALVTVVPAYRDRAARAEAARNQEVTVLVAAHDLPAMSIVTADAIVEQKIAAADAPKGYLGESVLVIGQVLKAPLIEGQAFSHTQFAGDSMGLNLATALPKGKRAVTVGLHDDAGLEGLIYPGAQVDVLASFELPRANNAEGKAISTTLLQAIPVLAVNNRTITSDDDLKIDVDKTARRIGSQAMVTLLVDSRQAEALQLAMQHGEITLALRNPTDGDRNEMAATLLSEGRLAQLATFLPSSVKEDDAPQALIPTAQPVQAPITQTEPSTSKTNPLWDVTILRGGKTEIRSFPVPDAPADEPSQPAKDKTQAAANHGA